MRADFFLQFKAEYAEPGSGYGAGRLKNIEAIALSSERPDAKKGDLIVKFEVDIPEELLTPQVKIEIDNVGIGKVVSDLKETERELAANGS